MDREFADGEAVCKAADFSVSGGAYTLREYKDSPFASDCLHPCAEELRSALGSEPARVVVMRRGESGWAPVPDPSAAAHGDAYRRAEMLLRSGKLPECMADSTRVLHTLAVLGGGQL